MLNEFYKKRNMKYLNKGIILTVMTIIVSSCVPELTSTKSVDIKAPDTFNGNSDTTNTVSIKWKEYFSDPNLVALIDTALMNNQELNIVMQEIEIARNEVMDRKGEYLPFVGIGASAGVDKVGRYTRNGALEATTEIEPGKEFPEVGS